MCNDVFGSLAGLLTTVGVTPSTKVNLELSGVCGRSGVRLLCIEAYVWTYMVLGEEAAAREIAQYMAHLLFSPGNKASTVEGRLVAVQHFHSRGEVALSTKHFIIKSAKV